jgi:hypothetical protein
VLDHLDEHRHLAGPVRPADLCHAFINDVSTKRIIYAAFMARFKPSNEEQAMPGTRERSAPIAYERYKADAARLRSQAIAEAFGRLRRLFGRRGPAASTGGRYGALGVAGCGQ